MVLVHSRQLDTCSDFFLDPVICAIHLAQAMDTLQIIYSWTEWYMWYCSNGWEAILQYFTNLNQSHKRGWFPYLNHWFQRGRTGFGREEIYPSKVHQLRVGSTLCSSPSSPPLTGCWGWCRSFSNLKSRRCFRWLPFRNPPPDMTPETGNIDVLYTYIHIHYTIYMYIHIYCILCT